MAGQTWQRAVGAGVVWAMCLFALSGCQSDLVTLFPVDEGRAVVGVRPDDEQVAMVMDDVWRGMETRRIYQVLANVSRSYRDAEGRDYKRVEAYLNDAFARYKTIRIRRVPPRVVVEGDLATVVESFGTWGDPIKVGVDPVVSIQGQVTARLQREGGRWKIVEWSNLP